MSSNILVYDRHIQPIIMAAYGAPSSGRETVMVFMAEILWENAHLNLKAFEFNEPTDGIKFTKFYNGLTRVPYGVKDGDIPIIMIPKIPDETVLKFLRNYSNLILFKVTRSEYKEGNQHSIVKTWEEPDNSADKWVYRTDIKGNTVFPVSNGGTMRVLKFQLNNMFANEVVNSKIWKTVYGTPETAATTSK